jgi:AcrR family transcriptional regulator
MNARQRILQAAAELLTASGVGEVSTRAVCERAGVGAPTLYRYFGDKEGLVTAVVDSAFETYLGHKRNAVPHEDPLVDLRAGWDTHTAWALDNPSYYLLIFASRNSESESAAEAMSILRNNLERCAAAGFLRLPADTAAQIVMAANVGVALMLITRPELYTAANLSETIRDLVHSSILSHPSAASESETDRDGGVAAAASTLHARLATGPDGPLSSKEKGLLYEWLERIGNANN